MKRILMPVLSLLMFFSAVSCTQENDYSDMKAVLGIEAYDVPDVLEVNKRQQKTVNIKAIAESVSGVTLDVTLGVDPELVAAYNEANGTSYEMLPSDAYNFADAELMIPRFNTESSLGQLTLVGRGCVENQIYVLPVVLEKVEGSDNYEFSVGKDVIYLLFKMLPALKGTGTVDDPYLIEELNDFLTMNEKLLSGAKTYFIMTTDIDMAGVTDFMPLNSSPYDCEVVFDGQGHKISNYTGANGLFHVLNGSIENLVFEDANVSGGASIGILAHYIGYTKDGVAMPGKVKNILFRNCKFKGDATSGMMAGFAYNAIVENVYAENCEVTLTGRRHAAFVGRIVADTEFKNCYMKGGKVEGGSQQVGGLFGENLQTNLKISYCGISAEFTGTRAMGAILAYANGTDQLGSAVVENCLVWSPGISANPTAGQYSSGAIVGCSTHPKVTFRNNLRRSDFAFVDFPSNPDMNPLRDMQDIVDAPCPAGPVSGDYNFAYHGKAAAAGKTASQAAKDLGWDETVWDLSGDEPALKTIK